ncbi:lytic transglycosylase F [Mangrovimicrobium sediminis]|uniref:Lytic transglycosylase F n=1 Tax=Mangrovimicrobium sediminis TaxID=2562682 RepID=A0A4Z0M8J6_9GAMM|nr:lytic transglycosylase F [Haliea sp. SAOS-164]TGD75804.1 lytic transglycosylase F [Haliea sp. SAOS-164]
MPPRRFALLLASLLVLSPLVACGDARETTAPPANQSSTSRASDAQPVVADHPSLAPVAGEKSVADLRGLRDPWTGDLDEMVERRVLRLLTVYSPGRYYLASNGEEKGLTREMATRLEAYLNKRYKLGTVRFHVAVVPLARSQLVPALLAGYGDLVVAGLTITEERREDVDFSIPISKPVAEILVTGPAAPSLETIDDLAGETVYVREQSSYRESLEALNADFAERGLDPVEIELVSGYLEDDDLIEMVNTGLLPWIVVDDYKLIQWKDVFSEVTPRPDLVLRESGRQGWAMRKNSPQLASAINDFLRENREGTLIGNVLRNRYVRDFDFAAHALDQQDYARFIELQHLFEKYGEQYEVDYLLAAAQGYQESRLDQSVRSHAGAVGIMQLLPSTASDKNVGIDDIHEAEPNIHAGIKYVAFLRGRYFSGEDIDRLNGTLLALAAYNAGPARVAGLRARARELGYDPNVWFDNVELVAAKEIGRETVQYVANIFKYYLAYRFSLKQQARRAEARERAGIGTTD